MKTLYTLLLAFFSFSTISYAQLSPSFGLRGGLAVSTLRGEATQSLDNMVGLSKGMVSTSSRTGFYGGGYVNIPVNEIFSVEPGLYYTQKGYSMKGNLDFKVLEFLGANASAELQSSYIDLPLLLKVNVVKGLQVYAGPQVSYLAQSNLQMKAGALGFSLLNKNIDVTDQFNKWDAAITGGLGYQFDNGFNIHAGYDYGLSKVDAGSNVKSYNGTVKVGVGFSF